ncbi:MAG: hypothetical protein JXR46_16600 [Calditrichaceae bacterium]|nr:hypothetical protein [Calditrichaceae bacterium]RQV96669.1 MAG: hypothetical protein EH224_03715 [Calditrichota bacterium]
MFWKNKIYNRMILSVLTVFIISADVYGRDSCLVNKHWQGRGYFMFGGSSFDFGALNSRLQTSGYPKVSDDFLGFGGGGHIFKNRWIIGGEGHGFLPRESENSTYRISVKGGYGFLNLGYFLHQSAHLSLYPMIGFGGGGIRLKIEEKSNPSFNDVLDDPGRNSEISILSMLLNFSLGADYQRKINKEEKHCSVWIVGFRIGYILDLEQGKWMMGRKSLSGAPAIAITGPYARLLIGFGGIHPCRKI